MAVVLQSERERAYKRLVERILSGRLDPDTPLSERRLADELGIGRTPIREALRDLEHEGLVEVQPARGTFVRRLSLGDLHEIYEVRQALESMAAFLAAKRGPTPALLEIEKAFRKYAKSTKGRNALDVDDLGAEFHLELFRAAANQTLQSMFERMRNRFQLEFGLPRYAETNLDRTIGEHLDILDAVKRGDAPAAQQLMSEHLANGLKMRMEIFRTLDDYTPVAMEVAE